METIGHARVRACQGTSVRAVIGAVVAGFLAVACASDPGMAAGGGVDAGGAPPGCIPYSVPAGTDLMHPAVTFSTDVMKVFNNSCGSSMCHGTADMAQAGLFLGLESAHRSDSSQVRAGLVGTSAAELPTMPLVTPGDPAHSFVMHKLDGDQCMFTHACTDESCQALMPSGQTQLLPAATRDTVRRWIAQGALDD